MREVKANLGRVAAVRALMEVEEGAFVEEELPHYLPEKPKDRALAWYLALGTLRRRAEVDAALRPLLRQPLMSMDPPVRAVLRVSTFEALFARTARHAVVHQAVEVARMTGAGRASGLINAVIRRVEPSAQRIDEKWNLPPWLASRWADRYGKAAGEWAERNAEAPPLFIVATPEFAEHLREEGYGVRTAMAAGEKLEGVWKVIGAGRVEELPGYDEGEFWVMDAGSAYMADLVQGRGTVLDTCAAPGGKSMWLASKGATVFATDKNPERLARLKENAKRVKQTVRTRPWDWMSEPVENLFDSVIVDAPCSALGMLRRHPEIKWRRTEEDIFSVARKQARILYNASKCVADGGELVYIVCSPEPEEGPDIVRYFLRRNPQFRLAEERTTAPPQGDEEGLYGARMVLDN